MNLFSYHASPGYRRTDTSREAAADMAPRQRTIQDEVLAALEVRPMASFELASHIGRSYRSVQPRTAELSRAGKICDCGLRREDPETGKRAIVWRLA